MGFKLSKELEKKCLELAILQPKKQSAIPDMPWVLRVPIKILSESNTRSHHMARYRRFEGQKEAVGLSWAAAGFPVRSCVAPVTVTFHRIGARLFDKHDNLRSGLKACCDAVAAMLGLDDGDERIEWRYEQSVGKPCVQITVEKKMQDGCFLGVRGNTIRLRSGKYFDFANPTADMIDPEDIAWGLATKARFAGHLRPEFDGHIYSVAQHSVAVHDLLYGTGDQLAGLVHDASEYVMTDIPKPLKIMLPDFCAIEERVERVIAEKFGLSYPWSEEVKLADKRMLRTEQKCLTAISGDVWAGKDHIAPLEREIHPWSIAESASIWLNAFNALMK